MLTVRRFRRSAQEAQYLVAGLEINAQVLGKRQSLPIIMGEPDLGKNFENSCDRFGDSSGRDSRPGETFPVDGGETGRPPVELLIRKTKGSSPMGFDDMRLENRETSGMAIAGGSLRLSPRSGSVDRVELTRCGATVFPPRSVLDRAAIVAALPLSSERAGNDSEAIRIHLK